MKSLPELIDLLRRVTGPGASGFYRTYYGLDAGLPSLEIQSWEEWRAIPLLTKDALLKVPLPERAFPPRKNTPTIVASSGTSGKPPLFSPFPLMDGYGFRREYHTFSKATLVSLPTPHKKEWEIRRHGTGRVVALDPKRTRASVRLARAAGVDSMFLFLYHIPAVAEEMVSLGMNGDIRYIEVSGEACSHSLYAFMRAKFPNAIITSEYGSTDVEATPIGIPCRPIDGAEPLEIFHTNERFFLEILHQETAAVQEIRAGTEGELVITGDAGPEAAFPLVRYRHGDIVRVEEEACAKHGEWTFRVLGRRDADFIKVPGGVLRADEVARVLRGMHELTGDDFQIRIYDDMWRDKPSIRIALILMSPAGDLGQLAREIASKVRIGHAYTLADAVADGLCRPLDCEKGDTTTDGKHRRIIRA